MLSKSRFLWMFCLCDSDTKVGQKKECDRQKKRRGKYAEGRNHGRFYQQRKERDQERGRKKNQTRTKSMENHSDQSLPLLLHVLVSSIMLHTDKKTIKNYTGTTCRPPYYRNKTVQSTMQKCFLGHNNLFPFFPFFYFFVCLSFILDWDVSVFTASIAIYKFKSCSCCCCCSCCCGCCCDELQIEP